MAQVLHTPKSRDDLFSDGPSGDNPVFQKKQKAAFEAAKAWSIKPDDQVKMLWQFLHEIRVDVNALRLCLLKSGVMGPTAFEIERHRARFEWYVERQGPSALKSNSVMDALLKSVAGILFNLDGSSASRLDQVSSGFHSVCSHLSRVCVVGGLDMQGKRPLGGSMQALDTVESLDVVSGDWDLLASVPMARMRAGSAVAKGKLYLLGGLAGERAITNVDCLDMLTGVWESGLPPMLSARAACAAGGLCSRIYVLGGSSDGRHFLSSAECYSETTRSWQLVPHMEMPRGAFAAVSLGGKIYAMGGLNAQQTLSSCERFDPALQAWEPLPSMRTARSELATTAFNGRVIVIGGFSNSGSLLGSVESFSPETGCWEAMPPMPTPLAACVSVISKGRIYVLGGSNGRRTLPLVQLLVPGETTWRVGPPMRSARMSIAAGTCLGASWSPAGLGQVDLWNSQEDTDSSRTGPPHSSKPTCSSGI